ncbi:hypothetical protein [Desulfovibrio gilichinskyi]|uniref:hypothetical protein n=1 Tax=Desulfovibrio gilichinskyi TaxID=1519643 RepID=UPI001482427A|nr:hypothetical protein [Desulfovibrio gilichinskyi]
MTSRIKSTMWQVGNVSNVIIITWQIEKSTIKIAGKIFVASPWLSPLALAQSFISTGKQTIN